MIRDWRRRERRRREARAEAQVARQALIEEVERLREASEAAEAKHANEMSKTINEHRMVAEQASVSSRCTLNVIRRLMVGELRACEAQAVQAERAIERMAITCKADITAAAGEAAEAAAERVRIEAVQAVEAEKAAAAKEAGGSRLEARQGDGGSKGRAGQSRVQAFSRC